MRQTVRFAIAITLLGISVMNRPGLRAAADPTMSIASARVTIEGTSNIHEFTASTTAVRLTGAQLAATDADIWQAALKPGGLARFEVSIPAATLSSPREGLDKNMHKALRVQEFKDITFRLSRIEAGEAGAYRAIGLLKIAGVEREITLDLRTEQQPATLKITGSAQLLMTDYGIKPPTAMMGMLKTDNTVKVTFETVLATPLT